MKKNRNIVDLGHLLISDYLTKDTIAVDMTLGNGHDSLFLAKRCKHVYAYEIQELGINNSIKLFNEHSMNNLIIINKSHEYVSELKDSYSVAIFNLGYLPGSDKSITTSSLTTVKAVNHVLNNPKLKVLLIVVYPGHKEGMIESLALNEYIRDIDPNFKITKVQVLETKNPAPYLLMIEKKQPVSMSSVKKQKNIPK
ncbi:MAG: class I SAM-dependent methyltransferase [Acholeplasma sp.]|nr:class I SAM-dependent methyltransferase [Acholeplasma sp.]